MRSKEDITNEIHEIAREFSQTKQKPYIAILQPRRSLKETPAQQLKDWKNRMVDVTSVAVSYHAIDGNPVDSARCYLMEKALEDDAKYALFIDEDTALPYDGVIKMVEVSKKFPDAIISGVYYVKFGNVMMSVCDEEKRWVLPDVSPEAPLIRNVVSTGLGCALIPIHLIRKIKSQFPDIPLFCIVPEKTWGDEEVTFIGEDTWFFNLARKCGIETIGVPSVQCLHMELATGKYSAHPDVKLWEYLTNIPPAEPLTLEDRLRVSKDYIERMCKPQYVNGLNKPIKSLLVDYSDETLRDVTACLMDIPTTQNYYEVARLCERLKALNLKTILEIGVESGGSMNLWLKFAAPNALYVGVDTTMNLLIKRDHGNQVKKFIKADSCLDSTLGKVKEALDSNEVDFLFIDGGHDEATVRSDFLKYSPLVRKGGIIALHDINPTLNMEHCVGIKKVWKEITESNETIEEFINTESEMQFGIGVIYK